MNFASMFLMGAVVALSSCNKTDDPVPSSNPDVKVTMNQSDGTGTASNELGVKNGQGNVLMQVTAITQTNNDMSRLYVYVDKDGEGKESVGFENFKQDANDRYYYDIPNDSRNNFTIDLSAPVSSNTTRVTDVYYFYFTSNSAFDVANPGSNIKIGPGSIKLVYNKFDVVATTQRLYSVCAGTGNNGAYNLQSLTGVTTSVNQSSAEITVGSGADMANSVGTANCVGGFVKGWVGQNSTTFVKVNGSDYDNATLSSVAAAFSAGTTVSTVSNVVVGDVYIAKLRGTSTYAVLKVTAVTDAAGNNDFIEFSVKK